MQLCYTGKFKLTLFAALMAFSIMAIMVFGAGTAFAGIIDLYPANGSTINTSSPTITATFVIDDMYSEAFDGWSMNLDGTDLPNNSCSISYSYSGRTAYIHVICPVSGLSNGTHTYSAWFCTGYYEPCEWEESIAVSFNVSASADTTPPVTTDNAPAGWQNHNVTVTLSCADSGSGCASTTYELDGGATQTGNSVTVSSDGTHTITYRSTDNAGNTEGTRTATVRIDKTAPSVSNIQPSGTIGTGSTTASASFSDATSGINTASASLAVYGGTVSGCVTTASGISCDVTGLADGDHAVTVSVSDNSGNTSTSTGSFAVSTCQPAQPALEIASFRSFWASYADYTAGLLSVEYILANAGPGTAYEVAFVGATNTMGVTVASSPPVSFGDIAAGAGGSATVSYRVPAGVGSFKTSVYVTASDACGAGYSYPGAMPGA